MEKTMKTWRIKYNGWFFEEVEAKTAVSARKAFLKANEGCDVEIECIEEKKGIDIKVIDISKISVLADYFIIAGGNNIRQIQSIADNVEEKLGKAGVVPKSMEGYHTSNWILMDYRDIIIHIFNQEERLFYDLERIWADGTTVEAADL